MQHSWYEADVKIYTPRFGFSASMAECANGFPADCSIGAEDEQLLLWTPAAKQLSDCAADSRTTQAGQNQP